MDKPELFALKQGVKSEGTKILAREMLKNVYERILIVINTYLDIKPEYAQIVAHWIIGTYIHKEFNTFPRLFINATKGSGKSRLLQILAGLCYNASVMVNLSEAVLFRTAKDSTILIDEGEGIGSKEKTTLRELLNSGYKKGTSVKRMKKMHTKEGEQQVAEEFDLYCPVALANISGLESVLSDRSITIILEKSDDASKTSLIEDFERNPILLDIKRTLSVVSVVLDGVVGLNILSNWNIYTLTTLTALTTQTTLTTPISNIYNLEPFILDKSFFQGFNIIEEKERVFFDKIRLLNINGRNLELFFPLFLIAREFGDNTLEIMMEIAKVYVESKKVDELIESRDIALIDFVARQEQSLKFISVSILTQEFKGFVMDERDEEDSSVNIKWVGRALKRLNLILDKRRLSKGYEVILNIGKAKQKLKMFKSEEKPNEMS